MASFNNEGDAANGSDAMEEVEEHFETQTEERKHKKMKMGNESGCWTHAERFQLRHEQRELAQKLQDGPSLVENDKGFVGKTRKKNNKLFEKVRLSREAVLDAKNMETVASKFVQQADSKISAPRYDALKLVAKLRSKLLVRDESTVSNYFDWQTLGIEATVCFNSIPSRVSFLVGPLANVKMPEKPKVRVARQKKAQLEEQELVDETPEQIKKEKKNVDRLSAAGRNLKVMRNVLKKRSNQSWDENFSQVH